MAIDLLSYQPLFERYARQMSVRLAAYSFASIYVWQDFFDFEFEEVSGNLCVFATDGAGTFLYLPPLGPNIHPDCIAYSFEKMGLVNKGGGVTRIDNVADGQLGCFPADRYRVALKGHEYVYYRRDLASLKGGALKSRRHDRNVFVKRHKSMYRAFEPAMAEDCIGLFEAWRVRKKGLLTDEQDLHLLEDSARCHYRAIFACRELGLVGRVVEVEGNIAAYTFGYFVGGDTFCDLLEITDIRYPGLSAEIFCRICADPELEGVAFINVMDDFAPGNVNRSKMSFCPALLLAMHTVCPQRV